MTRFLILFSLLINFAVPSSLEAMIASKEASAEATTTIASTAEQAAPPAIAADVTSSAEITSAAAVAAPTMAVTAPISVEPATPTTPTAPAPAASTVSATPTLSVASPATPGYLETAGSYLWPVTSAAAAAASGTWSATQWAAGGIASAPSAAWSATQWAASGIASAPSALYSASSSLLSSAMTSAECLRSNYMYTREVRMEMAQADANSQKPSAVSSQVDAAEKSITDRRKPLIKASLKKLLDEPKLENEDIATIGVSFSGGGVRAMYETLGWLSGAQRSGLYDCLSYMSGLSGSTWALNPYLASQLSLRDYKNVLIPQLTKTLSEHVRNMRDDELKEFIVLLGRRYYNNQRITPIDIYGALLTHIFLKGIVPNAYEYPLSSLIPILLRGEHPFPLSTAVLGGQYQKPAQFLSAAGIKHWPTIEFSPVSVGSHELGAFVPTWGFGRVYNSGISVRIKPNSLELPEVGISATTILGAGLLFPAVRPYLPYMLVGSGVALGAMSSFTGTDPHSYGKSYGREVRLGHLMGIFGSAFSANTHSILLELYKKLLPTYCPTDMASATNQVELFKLLIESLLERAGFQMGDVSPSVIENPHYAAAWIPNPVRNLTNHPFSQETEIAIVDGGHELINHRRLNIGIIPLLQRKMNVIIICDSSHDLEGAPSLKAAEDLARALKLPFPRIDYKEISSRHISTFVDEQNLDAPIIVYMPCIANERYDRTFDPDPRKPDAFTQTDNFTYSETQAHQLMDLIEYNVLDSKAQLIAAINRATQRKRALRMAREQAALQASVLGRSTIMGRLWQWKTGSK